MSYLFLDIEWYAPKNRIYASDILEIGAINSYNDFRSEKSFFTFVKPKRGSMVPEQTMKFLKIKPYNLAKAPVIHEALKELLEKIPTFEYLIVWSKGTYKLLMTNLEKCSLKLPNHKVIFLQDLVNFAIKTGNTMGFEKVLEKCGVHHNKRSLHHAGYDAICLKRLYCNLLFQIERNHMEEKGCYCVRSTQSNTIHSNQCSYAKKIHPANLAKTSLIETFKGAAICKHCYPKLNGWLSKIEQTETNLKNPTDQFADSYIRKACQYLNLSCQIGERVIFVKGTYTNWRIYHDYSKVTNVQHENYRMPKYASRIKPDKKGKALAGFHTQKNIQSKDLYGILQYICQHERTFFQNNSIYKGGY